MEPVRVDADPLPSEPHFGQLADEVRQSIAGAGSARVLVGILGHSDTDDGSSTGAFGIPALSVVLEGRELRGEPLANLRRALLDPENYIAGEWVGVIRNSERPPAWPVLLVEFSTEPPVVVLFPHSLKGVRFVSDPPITLNSYPGPFRDLADTWFDEPWSTMVDSLLTEIRASEITHN